MSLRGEGSGRWETIGKNGMTWQIRHINHYTDGQARHWPGKPYRPSSEEKYLIQLAKAWVKKDGLEQRGVEYYLDKLPDGYAVFEIKQPSGPQVYKRLFGHPSGRYFDSIVRFEVHFLWLMSGMTGICECVHCGNPRPRSIIPRTRLPLDKVVLQRDRLSEYDSTASTRSTSADGHQAAGTSSRPQRQIKAVGAPYAHDEEGVEDVYKELIKRLEGAKGSRKGIEDDIREINSMDWRAEHSWDSLGSDLIQRTLTTIEHQHSFVPRVGELVLWCPQFLDDHYLMLDEETGEHKFYSMDQQCFHGFPAWRGGVVASVPTTASDGPVDFPDIQTLPGKRNALNTSGFRVETFPDPNNEVDKKASKQYRYVPLRNIRPLSHWQMLLRGIPQEKWHPSIRHALTCMTSISLLEKWWFDGQWPNASIRCKGIFIGAELITVGNTVRIAPQATLSTKSRKCTDVLVVESIRLNLLDIKAEHVSPDSPLLSSRSSITLVGKAYTIDIHRHYELQGKVPGANLTVLPSPVSKDEVKTIFRPVGSGEYGSWYHLHDPAKSFEISYDGVLGRLYEAAAVQLWTGMLQGEGAKDLKPAIKPSLDYDMQAIEEGRRYATQADLRLDEVTEGHILWFWADTRAEALDIETINGVEVSKYHDIRDKQTLEAWRTQLRILNGHPIPNDLFKFTSSFPQLPGATRGRKPGSKVVNGKVIQPGTPGYDEAVADRLEVQSTPKHKSSQLAGAALVSTDDEEDVFEDAEDVLSTIEDHPADVTRNQSPLPQQEPPRTKQQIMSTGNAYISDEDDWYNQPLPVRGGTEESEGGDYDPGNKSD